MITLNGLKSCDSCKKALKWLMEEGIEAVFRDVRADPVSRAEVTRWGKAVGFDVLVNKASTTWRGLDESERAKAAGPDAAALLVAHPTLIKRPVFESGAHVIVGFKADQKAALKAL